MLKIVSPLKIVKKTNPTYFSVLSKHANLVKILIAIQYLNDLWLLTFYY
ncbi:hypothetical protein SAMN04515674_110168 [Pseudarcicella hirudinis]|uniref:Uncharacterized protein n=1 Tax=Pseudarcicella hirudinis TaxID=1079859 RepID=A0A1I5W094_9BACT|nr:hypothetical protein SAMN04515674_110168 [Pseudarcicella hirudinis]